MTQENKLVLIGLATRWEERAEKHESESARKTAIAIQAADELAFGLERILRRQVDEHDIAAIASRTCAKELRLIIEGIQEN